MYQPAALVISRLLTLLRIRVLMPVIQWCLVCQKGCTKYEKSTNLGGIWRGPHLNHSMSNVIHCSSSDIYDACQIDAQSSTRGVRSEITKAYQEHTNIASSALNVGSIPLCAKFHAVDPLYMIFEVGQARQPPHPQVAASGMPENIPSLRLLVPQMHLLHMGHHVRHAGESTHAVYVGKLLVAHTIDTLRLSQDHGDISGRRRLRFARRRCFTARD